MTILTSLLIASQGLLPSPTPLSIGSQGLLQIPSGPPPPPPIVARDLPGGFYRERQRVVVEIKRGVAGKLKVGEAQVQISSAVGVVGARASSAVGPVALSISAQVPVTGMATNISANRIKPEISTSFEIVGCREENELEILMLAQAALEEFYLEDIVNRYKD
jgi:hypothetical protein